MRKHGLLVGALGLMLLCGGCKTMMQPPTPTPPAAEEPAYVPEFSIGLTAGTDAHFEQILKQAAKDAAVSEEGEEVLRIAFYDTTQLGASADILAGMKLGTISMVACHAAEFSAEHPEWSIFSLPDLHKDVSAFNDWYRGFHNLLNAHYAEKELHVLGVFATSDVFLCAKSPVESSQDLRGKTIAVAPNVFEQTYWHEQVVKTESYDYAAVNAARKNSDIDFMTVTPYQYREEQLKMTFPYITPDKTRLCCMVLAINRAEWENLTSKQHTALENFVDEIYAKIEESQANMPFETFADTYDWNISTPSYELRETLLDRDATVQAYKNVLGREYVDSLFESISRYRNRYPIG